MEAKSLNSAYVFKSNLLIGTLSRTSTGAVFEYGSDLPKEGLSYRMPTSRNRYEISGYNLHPFFAGLLPEGLRLKALKNLLKTSEDDLFSLLLGSGGDTIGDISISTSKQLAPAIDSHDYELGEVSFKELFQKSISSADPLARASDLSVAGVQPKISAGMISFPVQVKMRKRFCILKLSSEEYPKIVENEYFFSNMAKACGLEVPPCSLVKDREGESGLLLERFDRRYNKLQKKSEKIHQEDSCQFLDRYPADKYRLSMSEIAEGVATISSAPIVEVAKLLRLKAFSYLIANGDLHAKNISLASTQQSGGTVRLTPAYDLVATLPYGDRSMALKFEGRDDNLKAQDFVNFGSRYGIREPAIRRFLAEITTEAEPWISRLTEIGLNPKLEADLRRVMLKRREDLLPK